MEMVLSNELMTVVCRRQQVGLMVVVVGGLDVEIQGVAAVLPPRYTAITLRQRLLVRLFLHSLQEETIFSPTFLSTFLLVSHDA